MPTRKTVIIGTNTYYIKKFEPFLSMRILGDIQKSFLGPLSTIFESQLTGQQMNGNFREGITAFSRSLDGESLVSLLRKVLNPEYISVEIGTDPAEKLTENIMNRAMSDVSELIELVVEVLTENYQNVFTLVTTHIGQVQLSGEPPLVN